MALTRSLPTQHASGLPINDTRLILAGDVARNTSGTPRLGIIPAHASPLVTGTAGMAYSVGPFNAVTSRTGTGVEKVANDAATSVATTAAPGANSRIDVIWVRPQFVQDTDAANTPLFGVTPGTAASLPAKPTIPAGALELATANVPSTATATNSLVVITQTYQYTALAGAPVWVRNGTELAAWTPAVGSTAFQLDTEVLWIRRTSGWVAAVDDSGWTNLTMSAGWTAVAGYTPRVRRVGKMVVLQGLADYSGGTYNNIATVPAGFRPDGAGVDQYLGTLVASLGTNGTAFSGPMSIVVATGQIAFPLAYANGTATPTRISFSGVWFTP